MIRNRDDAVQLVLQVTRDGSLLTRRDAERIVDALARLEEMESVSKASHDA